ncbi:hypothetical protein Cni_G10869 [Canna indica]|uniref:Peptidase A1 domain-containing protein n=1 Tax=Canna indica TaxID=4628 RepID=A0AAQ3K6T1_9LILI|nr:hypothetical protein Cni_G10869 [Canna indica]
MVSFASLLLYTLLSHFALTMAAKAPAARCATPPFDENSADIRILHAVGPCSPLRPPSTSWGDTMSDLMTRDESRLASLAASLAKSHRSSVPIASGRQMLQIPNYVVRASLGSPGQPMVVALDTSNDAAWFPCTACVGCPSAAVPFDSSRSSTFRPLPCGSPQCAQVPNPSCSPGAASCSFNLSYGGSSFQAGLAQDSLALGSDVLSSYTFGCLQKMTGSSIPPQGLLGLGRGPLSFLSQTKDRYASTFSYCLPSFRSSNFSGSLRLGPVGQPKRIKTTPLLTSTRRSSFYYVNMTGIRVGRRVLDIPPSALAFDPATGAGTIVDAGTMFTRLVAPAYAALRDEFRRQVKAAAGPVTSLGGFDTCYSGSFVPPAVTLVFTGMNLKLPPDNLLIRSTAGSMACLAMAAAPDNVNSVVNVIANVQQQNYRVLFDVANARIGFSHETCTATA